MDKELTKAETLISAQTNLPISTFDPQTFSKQLQRLLKTANKRISRIVTPNREDCFFVGIDAFAKYKLYTHLKCEGAFVKTVTCSIFQQKLSADLFLASCGRIFVIWHRSLGGFILISAKHFKF